MTQISAYDDIIGRTFTAPTQKALNDLMNHPRMVTWRASIKQRCEEDDRLNVLYGLDQINMAHAKRRIRQLKRIIKRAHG